jgi:hypothetical protein
MDQTLVDGTVTVMLSATETGPKVPAFLSAGMV